MSDIYRGNLEELTKTEDTSKFPIFTDPETGCRVFRSSMSYNYGVASNWKLPQAFREIIANWMDAISMILQSLLPDTALVIRKLPNGFDAVAVRGAHSSPESSAEPDLVLGSIRFDFDQHSISVVNYGTKLSYTSLLLGKNDEKQQSGSNTSVHGCHGEGMKMAILVFLRAKCDVVCHSGRETWQFATDPETGILSCTFLPRADGTSDDTYSVEFHVKGDKITREAVAFDQFLALSSPEFVLKTPTGEIICDEFVRKRETPEVVGSGNRPGHKFEKALFIRGYRMGSPYLSFDTSREFPLGMNVFNVSLNRDRNGPIDVSNLNRAKLLTVMNAIAGNVTTSMPSSLVQSVQDYLCQMVLSPFHLTVLYGQSHGARFERYGRPDFNHGYEIWAGNSRLAPEIRSAIVAIRKYFVRVHGSMAVPVDRCVRAMKEEYPELNAVEVGPLGRDFLTSRLVSENMIPTMEEMVVEFEKRTMAAPSCIELLPDRTRKLLCDTYAKVFETEAETIHIVDAGGLTDMFEHDDHIYIDRNRCSLFSDSCATSVRGEITKIILKIAELLNRDTGKIIDNLICSEAEDRMLRNQMRDMPASSRSAAAAPSDSETASDSSPEPNPAPVSAAAKPEVIVIDEDSDAEEEAHDSQPEMDEEEEAEYNNDDEDYVPISVGSKRDRSQSAMAGSETSSLLSQLSKRQWNIRIDEDKEFPTKAVPGELEPEETVPIQISDTVCLTSLRGSAASMLRAMCAVLQADPNRIYAAKIVGCLGLNEGKTGRIFISRDLFDNSAQGGDCRKDLAAVAAHEFAHDLVSPHNCDFANVMGAILVSVSATIVPFISSHK